MKSIRNVQLDSRWIKRKSQDRGYGFIKDVICIILSEMILLIPGGVIYFIINRDDTLSSRIILPLLSFETIWLYRRHPEDHYVARLKHYIHLVQRMTSIANIHAPREDIHNSQKITHYGRDSCPAEDHASRKSCITSQYSYIASQYSCIMEDHVSRFNTHASWKIMHRELIPMHRGRSCIAS